MDCPVCKYPNASGATHCGMCYEVFNRTAAQNYMHAVKRERGLTESAPSEAPVPMQTPRLMEDVKTLTAQVDWGALRRQTLAFLIKSRFAILGTVALIAAWVLIRFLFSDSLWYSISGKHLAYAFPKEPPQYLISLKNNARSWSERNGRLDTPMENYKVDEIGNLLMEQKRGFAKTTAVTVRAREWIQVFNTAGGAMSHTIPLKHPSLAAATILISKKGVVLERRTSLSPRLGKSIPFLAPRFPSRTLRRGNEWTEETQWLDSYNDWQILWKATLHWHIGDLEACNEDTCEKLTYTAEMVPQLHAGPAWAKNAVRRLEGSATGEGEALFDAAHKRLVANAFTYEGTLRMPIDNLSRIPWELRVGRGVHAAGDIVIRVENKIDLHKN